MAITKHHRPGHQCDDDLPEEGWIEAFLLRPDILDHDLHEVLEIKPDDRVNIAIGRTKVNLYIGVLALRHPHALYKQGTWEPKRMSYDVSMFPGIRGLTLQCTARNAGFGVIAYETNPSAEVLAAQISVAYEVSKLMAARAAEGVRAVQEWLTAALIDLMAGLPL